MSDVHAVPMALNWASSCWMHKRAGISN